MNDVFLKIYTNFKLILIRQKNNFMESLFQQNKSSTVLWIYNFINNFRLSNNHFTQKSKIYMVIGVKEICKVYHFEYKIIEKEKTRLVFIPDYYNGNINEKVISEQSPEIYMAELKDCIVVGESSAIIYENYCIFDMAAFDKEERYDLRFGTIRNISNNIAIIETKEAGRKIDKAISLVGYAPFNYYHTTVELLTKLYYCDLFEEYNELPIIVDSKLSEINQYKQLLDILNEKKHPIIVLKKGESIKVNSLIFFSGGTWFPINFKQGEQFQTKDFMISESILFYLRKKVLTYFKINHDNTGKPRKIFISRKNTDNSRLVNEKEVQKICTDYNFEVVYPETMSLREQVNLFSTAEYILGATGAAFTNLIYASPKTKVLCIIPKEFEYYGYSTIAHILGLKCLFIDAKVVENRKHLSTKKYKVNINEFTNLMKKLLEEM